jgi:tetratricopeptide (TPR) repeat protein
MTFTRRLAEIYENLDILLRDAVTLNRDNPCGTCNSCCTYPIRLQVSALELAHIYEHGTSCRREDFLDFVNNRPSSETPGGGTCPHYDQSSHGCAIYLRRPMCCRIFGYVPFRTLKEGCAFNDAERAGLLWTDVQEILSEFTELRVDYYRAHHRDLRPESIMDFLILGNVLVEEGNLSGAFSLYDRALQIDPGSALALSYQAKKHELEGRLEDAAGAYKKAMESDPEEPTLLIKRGFVLHGLGRLEEAVGHYREALSREAGNYMAYGNLGLAYLAMGEPEQALLAYQEASCHAPDWATAHIMRGNVLDLLGRHEEALSAYLEALKADDRDPLVYLCLGKIYRKIGETHQSLASFQQFLSISENEEARRVVEREIEALRDLA